MPLLKSIPEVADIVSTSLMGLVVIAVVLCIIADAEKEKKKDAKKARSPLDIKIQEAADKHARLLSKIKDSEQGNLYIFEQEIESYEQDFIHFVGHDDMVGRIGKLYSALYARKTILEGAVN